MSRRSRGLERVERRAQVGGLQAGQRTGRKRRGDRVARGAHEQQVAVAQRVAAARPREQPAARRASSASPPSGTPAASSTATARRWTESDRSQPIAAGGVSATLIAAAGPAAPRTSGRRATMAP